MGIEKDPNRSNIIPFSLPSELQPERDPALYPEKDPLTQAIHDVEKALTTFEQIADAFTSNTEEGTNQADL